MLLDFAVPHGRVSYPRKETAVPLVRDLVSPMVLAQVQQLKLTLGTKKVKKSAKKK